VGRVSLDLHPARLQARRFWSGLRFVVLTLCPGPVDCGDADSTDDGPSSRDQDFNEQTSEGFRSATVLIVSEDRQVTMAEAAEYVCGGEQADLGYDIDESLDVEVVGQMISEFEEFDRETYWP
jgi:hypothetical protein